MGFGSFLGKAAGVVGNVSGIASGVKSLFGGGGKKALARQKDYFDHTIAKSDEQFQKRYKWLEEQDDPTKMGTRERTFMENAFPGLSPYELAGVSPQQTQAASARAGNAAKFGSDIVAGLTSVANNAISSSAQVQAARIGAGASLHGTSTNERIAEARNRIDVRKSYADFVRHFADHSQSMRDASVAIASRIFGNDSSVVRNGFSGSGFGGAALSVKHEAAINSLSKQQVEIFSQQLNNLYRAGPLHTMEGLGKIVDTVSFFKHIFGKEPNAQDVLTVAEVLRVTGRIESHVVNQLREIVVRDAAKRKRN